MCVHACVVCVCVCVGRMNDLFRTLHYSGTLKYWHIHSGMKKIHPDFSGVYTTITVDPLNK